MESYNTAMVNDMKRSDLQPTASYPARPDEEAQHTGGEVPHNRCHQGAELAKLHLVMLLAFAYGV
jgi:hypothetical protein